MLYLSPEQEQRLRALLVARDLARVGDALGQAFPEAAARLGDRRGALVALGWQRARAHGLFHGLALARYLAAWFVFGAEFEQQPAHAWALELLGRSSDEAVKAHQLGIRCREILRTSPQPGLMPADQFEQALVLLDCALAAQGAIGSPLPRLRLQLGQPCDIGAILLELPDSAQRRAYSQLQGRWLLQAVTPDAIAMTLDDGQPLPAQLHMLAPPVGSTPARLRLRTHMQACCDPDQHPLLSLNGDQGLRQWRGQGARDWGQAHSGAPAAAGIGVGGGPRVSQLRLDSCGLRDSSAPLGPQQALLCVYPAAQQLLVWRRDMGGELHLPAEVLPAPATPRVRLERDGQTLDAGRWIAGLAELDRRLQQGLRDLLKAWEREAGLQDARLRAQPGVLAGEAGLTWGYREGAQPLADVPWMRMQAALDLTAWQLDLQLSGRLQLEGSDSLLQLTCGGREELQLDWHNSASETVPPVCQFRHPVRLQLQSVAGTEACVAHLAAQPAAALAGSLGLRARPDGPGFEWFVHATLEPVTARVRRLDPWLGSVEQDLPLLPALTVVAWSLA